MAYKRDHILKSIVDNLAFSSKSTAMENVIGLFDSNRIAQDFFVGLFSLVFGYQDLKELDKLNDITNYPAIDLGSEEAKIAFQITTNSDSGKIKDTINKFISHELYEKYDRLVIFIIGIKKSYTTTFNTQSKFSFNNDTDIWDDNFLIKEINKISDVSQLEEMKKFLEEKLLEFKFPERLTDSDIKKCIEILKRDFGSAESVSNIITDRKDDTFIKNIKNPLNNLSWNFFKDKIKGHIKYNKEIFDFLHNEINRNIRDDYLAVSQAIQDFYEDNLNTFSSFENVFKSVFNKTNILYDDELNKIKIMILLHNMYFNCDIGKNPDNHD